MRYVVIYYCAHADCDCTDRQGVIAYDEFDAAEAEYWLANVPAGYEARDESALYND